MTVKELIEKLQSFDPDLLVVLSMQDGGLEAVGALHMLAVKLSTVKVSQYGHYRACDYDDPKAIPALLIQ